jgi:hypothetical protein
MSKKEVNDLEKVVVENLGQLQKALEPFMTDTTIRKLLIEGMDLVKRQSQFAERNHPDADYGGFLPVSPPRGDRYMWVDTLIDRRLNGKRDGLKILWNLAEGQFEFNPWDKKLDKKA